MDELSNQKVAILDAFWSARLEVNSSHAIYHQWQQLETSGCIDNFRIALGEKGGIREGYFFADSDAYKWLDAAARIYATKPDKELAQLMDELIELIGRTQSPDGYIFTYNQIHFPGTRWTNLMIEHELYCHGHLIEAGVSHFQTTEQTSLLNIARKAADRIVADFSGKGADFTPGHEEIEIALLRLYRITNHAPYLGMAEQFIERRGQKARLSYAVSMIKQLRSVAKRRSAIRSQRQEYLAAHPDYAPNKVPPGNFAKIGPNSYLRWLASALHGKYIQQHAPIRKQTTPVGHSVRFGYLQAATAMLCRVTGDPTLLQAMEKTWERMVRQRMYVTGGIGAVPGLEGFGNDYELDPEYAYAETCAAIASLYWSWELALLTGEAAYSDLFEWQLYNAASVGMGLSGESYLYNNPLVCKGGVTRRSWYSVPCCPSNLSRTWADLGRYIYSHSRNELWIHQYIGSRATIPLSIDVQVELESCLPWDGKVRIRVDPSSSADFRLHLRIPSWAYNHGDNSVIKVNGEAISPHDYEMTGPSHAIETDAIGYDPYQSRFVTILRTWSPGDVIEMDFGMEIILRHAHRRMRGHKNKAAITQGPLVYCLESIDNPGVDLFSTRLIPSSLQAEFKPDLLEGCTILSGKSSDGLTLTFIPYHLWANRGESQMNVWISI